MRVVSIYLKVKAPCNRWIDNRNCYQITVNYLCKCYINFKVTYNVTIDHKCATWILLLIWGHLIMYSKHLHVHAQGVHKHIANV